MSAVNGHGLSFGDICNCAMVLRPVSQLMLVL